MTSRINPQSHSYNQLYPAAGVNQTTQGFRNNFSSLFENIGIARQEITNLHNKSFDFSQGDIIDGALTPARLVDDGMETQPVMLKLVFRPNPILPGVGAVTVPGGLSSDRPSAPTVGMIRYNTSLDRIEFFVGSSWVNLGAAGNSSYFNTSGDTITGDLTMASNTPGVVAQVLGDSINLENSPQFSFANDQITGIGHPGINQVSLVSNQIDRIVVSDTQADFSPHWPTGSNTEIHGQQMGFRQTKEYYIYVEDQMSGDWIDVLMLQLPDVAYDSHSGDILPTTRLIGGVVSFLAAAADTDRYFTITGTASCGCVLVRTPDTDPQVPLDVLHTDVPVITAHVSNLNTASQRIEFQYVLDSGFIKLQIKCTNDIGGGMSFNYDFTGKVTIHYGRTGVLVGTPIHN